MNSISNIGKAIDSEIIRQKAILESGERKLLVKDEGLTKQVKVQSGCALKKGGADYKYFPEANICPISLGRRFYCCSYCADARITKCKTGSLYEWIRTWGIREVNILLLSKELTAYFESALKATKNYKLLVNWVVGELSEYLNKEGINAAALTLKPENLQVLLI